MDLEKIRDEQFLKQVRKNQENKTMTPRQRLQAFFANNKEVLIELQNIRKKGNELWGSK